MYNRMIMKLFTTSKRLQATTIVQILHANDCLGPSSQYHHAAGPSRYLSAPSLSSMRFTITSNIQLLDIST